MKKKLIVLLVLAMLTGMVAGCGTKKPGTSNETKDSMTLGIVSDLDSFDNALGQNSLDFIVRRCLYDPLVHIDPYTGAEEMRLAESYEVNDADTEYTFHLRENVKMHDGSILDADDVVFSLQLAKESSDVGKNLAAMGSAEAVDKNTVKVTLSYPTSSFLKGQSMISIISEDQYNTLGQAEYSKAPVGTGPYKYISYENENKITFEAFEDYYRGKAAIKKIVIKQFEDSNSLAIAVEGEEVDAGYSVVPSAIENIKSNENIAIQQIETTKWCLMPMNTDNGMLSNVKIRQAISYAIDRDFVVDAAREGHAKAISTLFVSKFDFTKDVKTYDYNVEKAKSLIAESGVDVSNSTLKIMTYAGCKTEAEAVKSNFEAVGLKVDIEMLEGGTLYQNMMTGNFEIAICRNGTAIDDPDQYYNMVTEGGIGTENYARYANAEVKSLMDSAKIELDENKKNELYKQALEIIQEDCPYASIYEMPDLCTSVKGLNVNWGYNGMFYLYDFSWK